MNKKTVLFYIAFGFLMIGLGCSDALRGVFAPIFQEHFSLNAAGVSMIVTISYIGNLVFMLLGSRLADSFGFRRVFITACLCWICAMAVYVATDNYYALLFGVFFAMGTSTLLNTLMNVMSPVLFLAPGTVINTLFFIQGIGTTFTQGVLGSTVSTFAHWKLVNAGLIILGTAALILFTVLSGSEERLKKKPAAQKTPADDQKQMTAQKTSADDQKQRADKKDRAAAGTVSYAEILVQPVFWMFVLTFGFYFVAEHGVMNWMNIYCQNWLGMPAEKAALMPSIFFIGVMIGRLVFAPLVTKLGIRRMLMYSMISGAVTYVIAFLLGGSALYLLALSGLGFSIVYPTLTMCIQLFFRQEITTTASGTILAVATLFDIFFNACFGSIIDSLGYGIAMKILPVAAVLCLVLYVLLIRCNKPVREI